MSLEARLALGLGADPWAGAGQLDTADLRRVAAAAEAAAGGGLALVVGPRGSGKTAAWRAALRGREAVVEPLRLDRERLTIGDVASAIAEQLSDEKPRHSGEARAAQARRLLAWRRGRAVVVIDDAHLLHGQTARALKRLREMRWSGDGPLAGVLLLAQRDRLDAVPEVGLRTDRVRLAGLSATEAERALRAALSGAVEPGAVAAMARAEAARNWLDLRALADRCAEAAVARGAERIAAADVRAALGGEPARAPRQAPPADADVAAALARAAA